MIQKPMLAVDAGDISTLQYPLYATPKLDGIRCLKVNGEIVSRNFKPIPNNYIRNTLRAILPEGADGEICLYGTMLFCEVTSSVMRETGEPAFVYYMFDLYSNKGYLDRIDDMCNADIDEKCVYRLVPEVIENETELLEYEEQQLAKGFEGIMVRTANSPYKFGRSTRKEGYLLKIKRFTDSEAVIIGFVERMHNGNEATKDAFGRTERSSHKANMVPMGTLGALMVRDVKSGVEFEVGTGFDDAQRKDIWDNRDTWMGKIIKYKSQKSGEKDRPRFPVYLGIRDPIDM